MAAWEEEDGVFGVVTPCYEGAGVRAFRDGWTASLRSRRAVYRHIVCSFSVGRNSKHRAEEATGASSPYAHVRDTTAAESMEREIMERRGQSRGHTHAFIGKWQAATQGWNWGGSSGLNSEHMQSPLPFPLHCIAPRPPPKTPVEQANAASNASSEALLSWVVCHMPYRSLPLRLTQSPQERSGRPDSSTPAAVRHRPSHRTRRCPRRRQS